MALDTAVISGLIQGNDEDAWRILVGRAIEVASKPLAPDKAANEIIKREREIGLLDHFLSSSAWDLWQNFGSAVERTSEHLV